jgi:hypothetical protein
MTKLEASLIGKQSLILPRNKVLALILLLVDGSRAVVLEEAGKTYEVAREAAADWERGATELVARQEAKVAASSVDDYVVSSPKDYSRDVPTRSADTAKPSLLNEVASSVGRLMTPSAAAPAAPPPAAAELADVSEVIVVKAEPSNRKADVAAPAKPMATQPLVGKTNNLHSILAGSIKQAARKQGATYGVAIAPLTTITGATSLVTSPRQILVDNATQLQELLAKPADVARVDFKHQVVVAIFLGQMANETTITVTNISLNKNELIVRYRRETTAVKGNFTPYQLVVLPRQVESTILTAKHIFLQVEEDK